MTSQSSHLEVALSVAPGESIDVWDVHAGTHLKSFSVGAEHIVFLDGAHFACTQSDKASVQIWSWALGSVRWKCAMPERLSCLAVSHDGVHLAAGAPSGAPSMIISIAG